MRNIKCFLAMCGLTAAFALPASAQFGKIVGVAPVQPETKEKASEPSTQVSLTIHPSKPSIPALRYRLMPELRELKPGNAALLYYRAFAPEWSNMFQREEHQKALNEWVEDQSKMPPETLKVVSNSSAMQEIDRAARRAYCDWEMLDRLREDGVALLLPDIQSFRQYAILLAIRARFEIMNKEYDKAVYTLQTGYTFSRHVSQGPTLIQSLVGTAMAKLFIDETERLIQQRGSPNLYWSLAQLPKPFIDLHKPLGGEKIMFDNLFPGMRELVYDPEKKPLSAGEVNAMVNNFFKLGPLIQSADRHKNLPLNKLGLAVIAARIYPQAKKFLLEQGRKKEDVEAMPVTQAALMFEIYNYDRHYDHFVKWYGLPYAQAKRGIEKSYNQFKTEVGDSASQGTMLAGLLLPALQRSFDAAYVVDRKIAALRCIEAIRLHAAANGGKLPASLEDIEEVPVPMDPYTGKRFEFSVDGNTATLTAPVLSGQTPDDRGAWGNTWSYHITLKN